MSQTPGNPLLFETLATGSFMSTVSQDLSLKFHVKDSISYNVPVTARRNGPLPAAASKNITVKHNRPDKQIYLRNIYIFRETGRCHFDEDFFTILQTEGQMDSS